MMRSGCLRKK
ncbi:hypothetical protein D049_4444A, partial [Vibrio parahaemolyticus VPTS-2010]